MKYIKLFEDHTTDQPENSLEQIKSDLSSIAKGTFKYSAIDSMLNDQVSDEIYEPDSLAEFKQNYAEILIWIYDNIGISSANQTSINNMKRLNKLGVMSPFEFINGVDFGNIITLWDDLSQDSSGPVQLAKIESIFPNLIKDVSTGANNEMNINGYDFLCLPEPYTIIHKNLELNNDEDDEDYGEHIFIHATIATAMGLTFINIETFDHNMFFVKL